MIGLGYRYFWLDLEGRPSVSSTPQLRAFHEVISHAGLEDEVILYGSNVRREINPHKDVSACPASDVLSSPLGVDFIGVNRDPFSFWVNHNYSPQPLEVRIPHKARIFDSLNYDYVRFTDYPGVETLYSQYGIAESQIWKEPKFYSNFVNSFALNKEFDRQREVMLAGDSVIEYLRGKKSISSDIIKSIEKVVSSDRSSLNTSLNDWI